MNKTGQTLASCGGTSSLSVVEQSWAGIMLSKSFLLSSCISVYESFLLLSQACGVSQQHNDSNAAMQPISLNVKCLSGTFLRSVKLPYCFSEKVLRKLTFPVIRLALWLQNAFFMWLSELVISLPRLFHHSFSIFLPLSPHTGICTS